MENVEDDEPTASKLPKHNYEPLQDPSTYLCLLQMLQNRRHGRIQVCMKNILLSSMNFVDHPEYNRCLIHGECRTYHTCHTRHMVCMTLT
jgi:hypothetical protein